MILWIDTKHGEVKVDLYRYDVIKGCGNMYSAPSDIDYYGGIEVGFDVLENDDNVSDDVIEDAIIDYMGDV